MRGSGDVLLVACYELGHQPLALASPLAYLEEAGFRPHAIDLAVQPAGALRAKAVRAKFVAISTPMHTALRLGEQAAARVRQANPSAHICFYGLYAWLNADCLLRGTADSVIAGEYETPLAALIAALARGEPADSVPGVSTREKRGTPYLERIRFPLPRRVSLPPLDRYAQLVDEHGPRLAGYVEASRGCRHTCRHCPITPVYAGRFFAVPAETVLADIRAQAQAGATHITFGDPDFLNGPGHSLKIVRALHAEFFGVTFDFTAKVEHLLKHRALLPELRDCGCAFVVSAFESTSDRVLRELDKGHTLADMNLALEIAAAAGIPLRPSFVAFTPWTTAADYMEMLRFVWKHGLIDQVDPVQYSIRLLVPPGSALVSQRGNAEWLGELDGPRFTYRWNHPDPRMDALYGLVSARVAEAAARGENARATFLTVYEMACETLGVPAPVEIRQPTAAPPQVLPHLTEAWFC